VIASANSSAAKIRNMIPVSTPTVATDAWLNLSTTAATISQNTPSSSSIHQKRAIGASAAFVMLPGGPVNSSAVRLRSCSMFSATMPPHRLGYTVRTPRRGRIDRARAINLSKRRERGTKTPRVYGRRYVAPAWVEPPTLRGSLVVEALPRGVLVRLVAVLISMDGPPGRLAPRFATSAERGELSRTSPRKS
jgi:hypothetical protein